MKSIWTKYKEYILVLACLAVLFSLYYFVIRPLVRGIDYNANLIQEKMTIQDSFKRKLGLLSTDKEQIASIEKDESKMGVLLSPDQEVTLIERIEKIAEETNNKISIEAIDDKNANSGSKTKTTPAKGKEENKDDLKINPDNNNYVKFRITASGDYSNLIDFIKKIENMEYWSDITTLHVSYKEPVRMPVPTDTSSVSTDLYGSSTGAGETSVSANEGTASSTLEIIFYLNGKI